MAPSKRGLGWPYDNQQDAFHAYEPSVGQHKLTWLFNWEMWKPKGFPEALEYVPQVRTQAEAGQIDQVSSRDDRKQFQGITECDERLTGYLSS